MYQNLYVEGSRYGARQVTAHLWDDERGYLKFTFDPYCYVVDPNGKETSLYGDKLTKIPKSKLTKDFERQLKDQYGDRAVFESDVPIETRILIDIYGDSETPSKGHRELFFDIEVSMEGDLPNVKTAQNPITSIAWWNKATGEAMVHILDTEDRIDSKFERAGVKVVPYKSEKKLLLDFVAAWKKVDPTIITHWNGDGFDVPYLYRRLQRILGEQVANQLSPIGIVEYLSHKDKFLIAGVSSLDYLSIYKNFSFTQIDSYSLENVSQIELGRGKIDYKGREVGKDDGSTVVIKDLDDLLEHDIEGFIDYNMEDVWLIRDLDKKFDYLHLARQICHLGHVPYENIYMSSRYIDGAIISYLNRKGIRAPDVRKITNFKIGKFHTPGSREIELEHSIHRDIPKVGTIGINVSASTRKKLDYIDVKDNQFILKDPLEFEVTKDMPIQLEYEGAYVKQPRPGLYTWIYDLDLTSMYPSIIMSLNISPETKMGKIYEWDAEEFVRDAPDDREYRLWVFHEGQFRTLKKSELVKFLNRNDFSVASTGVFYRNDKRGVIPAILEDWFEQRQKYKGMRKDWEGKDKAKAEFYDKLQHVYKILINSVYGVLGLTVFRFYDIDNAGSVTETGQHLIKFTSRMGDHFYNKQIGQVFDAELENGETLTIYGTAKYKVNRNGQEIEVTGMELEEEDDLIAY